MNEKAWILRQQGKTYKEIGEMLFAGEDEQSASKEIYRQVEVETLQKPGDST